MGVKGWRFTIQLVLQIRSVILWSNLQKKSQGPLCLKLSKCHARLGFCVTVTKKG